MASSPPITLPSRASDSHKGSFGRVMLIGGSRGMAGSVALSSIAALHSGSGLVSAAVPDCILETVAGFHPALMTIPLPCPTNNFNSGCFGIDSWPTIKTSIAKYDAIGVGPGMTTNPGSTAIVEGLLHQRTTPVVFDADALNVIAEQRWLRDPVTARRGNDPCVVLTPHRGELARLTSVPASAPEKQDKAACKLALRLNVTIVIKGGPTQVVGPDVSSHYTNTTGNPAMATAGTGDVLTGIITSLLGQGLTGRNAARLGVWIHGLAGDEAAKQTSCAGMTSLHLVEKLAEVADSLYQD